MEKIITKSELEKIIFDQFYGKDNEKYERDFAYLSLMPLLEFFQKQGFDYATVGEIINGARKKVLFDSELDRYIRLDAKSFIDNVLLQMSDSDMKLYNQISEINDKFRKYFRTHDIQSDNLVLTMKKLWKESIRANQEVSNEMSNFTKESMEMFDLYASIYLVMMEHIGNELLSNDYTRVVDSIMYEEITKEKDTLRKLLNDKKQISAFSAFLDCLMDEKKGNEAFTSEEIGKLIFKSPSLIANATKEKWEAVSQALTKHIKAVGEKYGVEDFSESITSKSLLTRSVTIAWVTREEGIDFASGMLLGKTVKNVIDKEQDKGKIIKGKKKVLAELFPRLEIQGMDFATNKYILTNRVTTIPSVSANSIYENICEISACLAKAHNIDTSDLGTRLYKLEKLGYNFEKMFTKDNLFVLFPIKILKKKRDENNKLIRDYDSCKTEKSENIVENIAYLSKIVSVEDIQKIIQHNFKFLLSPQKDNYEELKKSFSKVTSIEEYKKAVEEFVNKIVKSEDFSVKTRTTDEKLKTKNKVKTPRIKKDHIEIEKFVFDEEFLKNLGLQENLIDQIREEQGGIGTDNTEIEEVPEGIKALIEEADYEKDDDEEETLDEKIEEIVEKEESENKPDVFTQEDSYNRLNKKLEALIYDIENSPNLNIEAKIDDSLGFGNRSLNNGKIKTDLQRYRKILKELVATKIKPEEFKRICSLVKAFDSDMKKKLQIVNEYYELYQLETLDVYHKKVMKKGEVNPEVQQFISKIQEMKRIVEKDKEFDDVLKISIDQPTFKKKIKEIVEELKQDPKSSYSSEKEAKKLLENYYVIIGFLNECKNIIADVKKINEEFFGSYAENVSENKSVDEEMIQKWEREIESKKIIIEKDLTKILSDVSRNGKGGKSSKVKSEKIKTNILEKGESPEIISPYYQDLAKKISKLNKEVIDLREKISKEKPRIKK